MLLSQQLQAELAAGMPLLHVRLLSWAKGGGKAGQYHLIALLFHQRFCFLPAQLMCRCCKSYSAQLLLWPKAEGMQHC